MENKETGFLSYIIYKKSWQIIGLMFKQNFKNAIKNKK